MKINWSPTPTEEVVQNVNCILATSPGSVPLARTLGIPQDLIDSPQSRAGALLSAAAIKAVRTYEPRVAIKSVKLVPNADGKLAVTATLGAP